MIISKIEFRELLSKEHGLQLWSVSGKKTNKVQLENDTCTEL